MTLSNVKVKEEGRAVHGARAQSASVPEVGVRKRVVQGIQGDWDE